MKTTQTKKIQDIQFDLMERASFNFFDGARVKQDLLANKHLWRGAIMGRFETDQLIPLRDIDKDYWNVDTLMISAHKGKESELIRLASDWHADEVDFLNNGEAQSGGFGTGGLKVLRLWWD